MADRPGPQVVSSYKRNPSNSNSNNLIAIVQHLVKEQERQAEVQELLRAELQKVHIEQAVQKVKSGFTGFLGGLVPVLIAIGVALIIYLVKK